MSTLTLEQPRTIGTRVVDSWNDQLNRFDPSACDIYYSEEYAALYAGGDVRARCFVREQGSEVFLMPFLEHPNRFLGEGRFDISTPYGYGGPVSTSDDPEFLHESSRLMFEALRERGAVAGFLRCHPLLQTHLRLGEEWNVSFDRPTVAADLTASEDEIWNEVLTGKGRNRVRKAAGGGMQFEVDDGFEAIDDFVAVYHHAMKLVDAAPFYFFDHAYFEAIRDRFNQRVFVARATMHGSTIAAMLFLYDDVYAHAHLSGSRAEYRSYGPNNFVIHQAMLEAKRRGCTRFHLGGGVSNRPDDTLYRFKCCFSRDRYEFHLGRTIFDSEAYGQAKAFWVAENPDMSEQAENHFPVYGFMGPAA